MKALGIDFGDVRIGLAISDPAGSMALPLETFERRNDRQAASHIAALAREHGVELLVLGEPVNVDGSVHASAERIARFRRRLAERTGLEVVLAQETLTSYEAAERLREVGVDPARHPEHIDAVAAQILLQQALDRRTAGTARGGP